VNPKYLGYCDKKYENWIRKQPCIICQRTEGIHAHHMFHARRNSYLCVPLCVEHHMPGFPDSYHHLEAKKFEERHNISCEWEVIKKLSEYISRGLEQGEG